MKNTYNESKDSIINILKSSDKTGLSNSEVLKRREEFGLNELVEVNKKSLFYVFLEQFKDLLVIILIIE